MIIIPAQIESVNTRRDSSLKLTIGTQELSPEKVGVIFNLLNKYAFVGIKEEDFTKEEKDTIESLNAEDIERKSQGKRIRAVLYVLFKQDNEGFESFSSYYDFKTEEVINKFKSQIV